MQKKYALLIILLTTSLLVLVSTLSIMNLKYSAQNEFLDSADQLTSQASTTLELWIEDQVSLVKKIARDKKIISLCLDPNDVLYQKEAEDYLKDIHLSYPYYENLPIALKTEDGFSLELDGEKYLISNGEFIVDTVDGDTIGSGGMQYSYVAQILEGKSYYISEIYPSIWRGNPIFVVSAPIVFEGEVIGVAIVSPQMEYFTKFLVDTIKLGETGYMFMFDSSGETIAHSNRDYILNDSPNLKKITNQVMKEIENDTGFFEAKFLGVKKFYFGQKIKINRDYIENDIYVVVTKEKEEIFRNVYKTALYTLISILIISFLLFKISMLFYKVQMQEEKEKQLNRLNRELELQVKARTLQLEDMANKDGLTNLFNHRYIHAYLETLLEGSSDQSDLIIVILDVDDFKKVNDKYGHKYGDSVLQRIGEILNQNIGTKDLAGRYGGEEFMLIFKGMTYSKCIEHMKHLREEIGNERYGTDKITVTVSIGMAKWKGDDSSTLINRADKEMYLAKSNGKNQVMFEEG